MREKVLSMRSRTKYSFNSSQQYRRFVTDSQFAFIEEASSNSSTERLTRLYEQLLRDHEYHSTLGNAWDEMETELANSEFDMQQTEQLLIALVERMLQLLDDITLPGYGASSS